VLNGFIIRRGFGRNRVKQYFVVRRDVDVIAEVISGPFDKEADCVKELELLKRKYNRPLDYVAGHLERLSDK
jgi:hypothetical protein